MQRHAGSPKSAASLVGSKGLRLLTICGATVAATRHDGRCRCQRRVEMGDRRGRIGSGRGAASGGAAGSAGPVDRRMCQRLMGEGVARRSQTRSAGAALAAIQATPVELLPAASYMTVAQAI